ncbi:MAG: hypothetical protein ACYTBS_25590 [Planctomycetota bacterium]|jgi:SSS family solute:Na+ symporter
MIYLVAIFIYLFVLAGIGIYKSRQVKTQEDFTVAGRTLSPWIMVCTMSGRARSWVTPVRLTG